MLAVFGHVERAWGYSIRPRCLGPRLLPFRNLISRVLKGEPVGHATKDLSDRFTAASAQLNQLNDPGLTHHFFRAYAPLFPAFLRVSYGN